MIALSPALQMMDNSFDEVGAASAGFRAVAGELAGDVVSDEQFAAWPSASDCFAFVKGGLKSTSDILGGFIPPHMFEHEDTRKQDSAGIGLILARVLGGGAMRGLEHGRSVANIGTGGQANAPGHGRRCVR